MRRKVKHKEWKCDKGWQKCDLCNYDRHPELFICSVCWGAEGELTKDCPGIEMTVEQRDEVYKGQLNYFEDKGWVRK